jgi:hypothetical protein
MLFFGLVAGFVLVPSETRWRLPVTIEVIKDVPAHAEDRTGQHRGTLHISSAEPFLVRKGQRIQMIKIYSEGECRIRFNKKEYDVSSCPWLDGFADHQADIFRVISARR